MSTTLPPVLDVWRIVAAQRVFEGSMPLSRFARLAGSLADGSSECTYQVQFSRSDTGIDYVDIAVQADLPLICQRSLERFLYPVSVNQRLGLIRHEAQEAALPDDMEPVLVPEDGQLHPADLLEDELILAVPVVAINPEAPEIENVDIEEDIDVEEKPNPFAALAALKGNM
jgi:uncharacterized protein